MVKSCMGWFYVLGAQFLALISTTCINQEVLIKYLLVIVLLKSIENLTKFLKFDFLDQLFEYPLNAGTLLPPVRAPYCVSVSPISTECRDTSPTLPDYCSLNFEARPRRPVPRMPAQKEVQPSDLHDA